MKKLLKVGVLALMLSACSQDVDKLLGQWISVSDGSMVTITKSRVWFNYDISTTLKSSFINERCSGLVLYSNSGFNCLNFPDKTARLSYQPAVHPENDVLIANDINSAVITYHRLLPGQSQIKK